MSMSMSMNLVSPVSSVGAVEGGFNASVFVSEQLNRQLVNTVQEFAHRCINECANHYNFNAEDAVRMLGLGMLKVERNGGGKPKAVKAAKVLVAKAAFPLPYNGEFNDACCYALRQNNGLYTQCSGVRKGGEFCKSCASQMKKTGGEIPEYGTIQQRQAVGIFEYVDPKGRRPISYMKVMKKYKITKEEAIEEAGKLGITIMDDHFVVAESDSKRGRPKSDKEVKEKGVKGRPKKEKKVLQIEGDEEDLFATLVAQANEESEDVVVPSSKSVKKAAPVKSDEEKEAERLQKEQEKAEKEAKRLQEKAEKEAKLAAEKAEKEAKKKADEEARIAKKKAEEEEKAAKKLADKKEKEEKAAAEKASKEASKKPSKKAVKSVEPEEEEEQDVVKKIEFEGKKYLKSKKTGIIYDYTEYVNNGEQVVVGKWNENTNKIEFSNDDEESEDEYDN
jgi:hypothetical protein